MKAVVIFNLGGPDKRESIKPFLFNLFSDPAIIRLPNPFRWLLAKLISSRREEEAAEIYQAIGGKSPIVEETQRQANQLQKALPDDYDVYICMRYWHPMISQVITQLRQKLYEEVILLPLYPQFSTTTTGSFFEEWERVGRSLGYLVPTREICCYPQNAHFVSAYAQIIKKAIQENIIPKDTRFLFSAHGLPEKIVKSGDPYPEHVALTVQEIVNNVPEINDWEITYQSKVGPLKWLEPSTEKEIIKAGQLSKSIAIVPVSFVSEHSETLYELDIQYRNLALESGAKNYFRIATVRDHPLYIKSLVELIMSKEDVLCLATSCIKKCQRQAA